MKEKIYDSRMDIKSNDQWVNIKARCKCRDIQVNHI